MNCARLAVQKNMRALALIPLLALVACSAQQQAAVTVPGTCVVDVQDEPFFRGGLLSLANGQIAERNTQRRAYARAHQSPDCPPETMPVSSAHTVPPPQDDGIAAAIEQSNMQNWLAQQQSDFWQMQNWQAQQQDKFCRARHSVMDHGSELLTKIPGNSTLSVIMSCVCRAGPA